MSLQKYLIIEQPKLFGPRFYPLIPSLGDALIEADWALIQKLLPEFRPIVLENGADEAMEMFAVAYRDELASEDTGTVTQLALLLLAHSFEDPIRQ